MTTTKSGNMSQSKFYVYKTTNLINGKIYIGVHESDDIENDRYLGSGKAFKRALKKYHRESFKREILFCYETLEEALDKERDLVNEDFILREDTYNLVRGGSGLYPVPEGYKHHFEGLKLSDAHKQKIGQGVRNFYSALGDFPEERRKIYSDSRKRYLESIGGIPMETREKISNTLTGKYGGEKHPMYGKKHTKEAREKISKAAKGRVSPNKGKPITEEQKEKMRKTLANRPMLKCPHCGYENYDYVVKRNH